MLKLSFLWVRSERDPRQITSTPGAAAFPPRRPPRTSKPARNGPRLGLISAATLAGLLAACQHGPTPTPGPASHFADISTEELRSTLADLARANSQKVELAFYASLPWQGVTAPYDAFYKQMGKEEGELSTEIQDWAKKNHMDLTYHYSGDIPGNAQKILEAREEKLVRGDSKADFTRDTLMQMYQDYEWQISEIQALLPHVKDPQLKAYLEQSLKIHTAGSEQIIALLHRFKAT